MTSKYHEKKTVKNFTVRFREGEFEMLEDLQQLFGDSLSRTIVELIKDAHRELLPEKYNVKEERT